MARPPGELRIGISGWNYPSWRGRFYPPGLPHRRELEFASRQFNSIELNGSFYSLKRPELYEQWRDQAPEGFLFAVKGSRFITHMKKLNDIEVPLANFLASGVLALGRKLGPMLWQFPELVRFHPDRFARFLDLLPPDTEQAARIARRHDSKVRGRCLLEAPERVPIRHAFEIRHESFLDTRFFRMLAERGMALAHADTGGRFPAPDVLTAPGFAYVRLHGPKRIYVSGYEREDLERWAGKIRDWRKQGRDVYAYFDNDAKVRAPFDATELMRILDVELPLPSELLPVSSRASFPSAA